MTYSRRVEPIDGDTFTVDRVELGSFFLQSRTPVTFQVVRVDLEDGYRAFGVQNEAVPLVVLCERREDLEREALEELRFIWGEYALASPETLFTDALVLAQQLRTHFTDQRRETTP